MKNKYRTRELIDRISRLDATDAWQDGLNPTQRAVLNYLSQANRFSRSPSQVADYLGTTRGTVSQSLKSLRQKGYVVEKKFAGDKRAISYELTKSSVAIIQRENHVTTSLSNLDESDQSSLQALLTALLKNIIQRNNGRAFGLCKHCKYFSAKPSGGFCNLLREDLSASEINLICHEQESA